MSDLVKPRVSIHSRTASADSTYDLMEDELTCPVCLELFADPLMLPCSHSICKKCLTDIIDSREKGGKNGLECPSCRKTITVTREKVANLPKNLALENIVFRFQEIQSTNLTRSSSLDQSSDLDLADTSMHSDFDETVFSENISEDCGLCDSKSPAKAVWYCQRCAVLYCQKCLNIYHPKKGSLSHHKIRKPSKTELEEKTVFCRDHGTEVASIFCDSCKVLLCHLCVCQGVGKHSGHKILALDAAWKHLRECVTSSKEQLESMMSSLTEQNSKLEELTDDVENIHKQARDKVDCQYRRFVQDVTTTLDEQRQVVLGQIGKQRSHATLSFKTHIDHNKEQLQSMESMAESCKKLLDEDHTKELLQKADAVRPIMEGVGAMKTTAESNTSSYKELITLQPVQSEIKSSVSKFKTSSFDCFKTFTGDDSEKCASLVPTIRSVASPGNLDTPRVQNKCLITWGFNSTTFTAEPLSGNSLWTVTVERNTNQIRDVTAGYLFGVGIAAQVLGYKDQVGINGKSYGVVCSNGGLHFCYEGTMDLLMPLDGLPMSVTVSVVFDHSDRLVFAYTLTSAVWGDTLVGKRVITNEAFKDAVHPVFTVSHRVKMQFPTHV
ncbi:E3 ubiquitin-protein ligase Midline-1-like isoform X2 [Gigantopelta aegis]|uniref:E3 ubiquitin-protein ligase Midline-1-like isoform X2 n=1 Tax=Gigantopelta aegis TaxID=1735272 RepID=UPI001B88B0CA|nr:E3 ubiquitin-protein ligase Midline-1-like isoform X2 [Gigantopelta aegis]